MLPVILAVFIVIAVIVIFVMFKKKPEKAEIFMPTAPQPSTASKYAAKVAAEPAHPAHHLNVHEPKVASNREFPAGLFGFHLMFPDDINEELSAKILDITKTVPRPHPILPALTRGVVSNEELFNLISADPEIAARILKTVNSSAFCLTRKITRLNHAILYLGPRLVKDVALKVAIHSKATGKDPNQSKAFEKAWSSSFLASSIAFVIAQSLHLENASEISTQALLFSIGNLALISYQSDPESHYYDKMSLLARVKLEQWEYGTNSAMIGEKLAIEWGLPVFFQHGIRNSLFPLSIPVDKCGIDEKELRGVVLCYAACRYAEFMLADGIKDIGEIDLLKPGIESTYFLAEYLAAAKLPRYQEVVSTNTFRTQINDILGKVVTAET